MSPSMKAVCLSKCPSRSSHTSVRLLAPLMILPVSLVMQNSCSPSISAFSERPRWNCLTWSSQAHLNHIRSSSCPENHGHDSSGESFWAVGLGNGALGFLGSSATLGFCH
jgi:hypothetical protein